MNQNLNYQFMATFCKFKVFLQCLLCGRPEKKETVENREIFFTTGGSSGNSLCWCTCHYNRDNPKATFYTPISELNQDQREPRCLHFRVSQHGTRI